MEHAVNIDVKCMKVSIPKSVVLCWKTMRLNLEMTCIHSHSVVISCADLKHIWVGLVCFVGGHRCISAQEE